MQDSLDASAKLLCQHTVLRPMLSFDEANATLERFHDRFLKVSKSELVQAVADDPTVQEAAITFLKYRYTPLQPALIDVEQAYAKQNSVAVNIVALLDDRHRTEFIDEVVFNVAHPANHEVLWPAIVAVMPAAELEKRLLERARSTNELHVNNALYLPSVVEGRHPTYKLAPALIQELRRIGQRLLGNPALNPLLRMMIESAAGL